VLETVPSKIGPKTVDFIIGKSWLNLCSCACIAGTKDSAVVKGKRHDAFIFPSKNINKNNIFRNKTNGNRKCKYV
jgi:hypothetical protein